MGEDELVRPLFRRFLLAVGTVVCLAFVGAALFVGSRWLRSEVLDPAIPDERSAAKQAYLESLPDLRAGDRRATPNVVVVLFDDLGWGDLSSYGNALIRTPRIDALAAEGVRMTRFYSAAPVCTPSRAALLTGRYPFRSRLETGVLFPRTSLVGTVIRMANLDGARALPRDEITIAETLGRTGYATGMVGKWHLGDRTGHGPNDFGFDFWFGVLWSNDMLPFHVYRNGEIEERDERAGRFGAFRNEQDDAGDGIDQRTLTQRYTQEAVRFIEDHRDEPFFLYFAHSFPHVPHFASPEHAGESEAGLYGDVVEDLDRSVGALVDTLDRLGLAGDTLLIVTSDNGADYNGSPGFTRGRKGETYEGGQRVPLIARFPGRVAAGLVTDEMGMNLDLLPTVRSLLGLPEPDDRITDGRDLMPVWQGRASTPHEALFYFSAIDGGLEAVRGPRFKYLEASGDRMRSQEQLFRMDVGIEAHNLATRHPEEAERLRTRLLGMREQIETNPRGWR